jgi:hypothetical protein
MTTADLLNQISEVVLTGGRRTTAINMRSLISNAVNSFANVDDGGSVFKKEVGYVTEIFLLDPKSFVYKKWVEDQIAAVSNPISGLNANYLVKALDATTLGSSRILETSTATVIGGPTTLTEGGTITMYPELISIDFKHFYLNTSGTANKNRVLGIDGGGRIFSTFATIDEVNTLHGMVGNVKSAFDTVIASVATLDSNVIHKTGDETKNGVLTFSLSPIGPSPSFPNELATKGYVDNLLTGLSWKNQVTAATTADIILSGSQTIDDIAITTQDVLVRKQYDESENGIYTANPSGPWTRRADVDTGAEIYKSTVLVSSGTANGLTQWTNNNSSVPTLETTPITYVKISAAGTYSNGAGISLSGNIFFIDNNAIVNSMILSMDAAKLTSVVTYTHGGLGLSSYANGDLVYFNGGAFNKLAIGTGGKVITSNGTVPVWADVFQNPMTGIGDFIMGGASGAPIRLASAALYNVMLSGGVGAAASWGKVNLTQHITDVLAPENGGTGTNVRFKPGTIPYASSAGILKEDNIHLWYDEYFMALNLQALVLSPEAGNVGGYIYTIDSLALDIVSGGGGINILNTDTGSFGVNIISHGMGIVVDAKDIAGYFTSDFSSAGYFSQIGVLSANNSSAALSVNRNFSLGSYSALGALLSLNDSTPSTGPGMELIRQGTTQYIIDSFGRVGINTTDLYAMLTIFSEADGFSVEIGSGGGIGGRIYTYDSLAMDVVTGGGGFNINNTDAGSFGVNVISQGIGITVDAKDIAGYFTSDFSSAGYFSQIGLLASNNTTAALTVNRNFTLNSFNATEAVLLVSNSTTATGDLFKAVNQGIDRLRIKPNGETFYYRQSDIAVAVSGVLGQVLSSVTSVGSTAFDAFTYNVKTLMLGANGDRLTVDYPFVMTSAGYPILGNLYFGSANFFTFNLPWDPMVENAVVELRLTRVSSTSLMFTVEVKGSVNNSSVNVLLLKNGTITTALSSDQTLRLNLQASVGAPNGHITTHPAKYNFNPANP